MAKIRKNIPLISSLLLFALFQAVLAYPSFLYFYLFILLVVFFSLFYLTRYSLYQKKFWYLFLAPALLFSAGFVFLYFLETVFFKQALITAMAFFNWFLYKNYYRYIILDPAAKAGAENIINYVSLVTAFLFFSGFFALRIFMNMPLSWLVLLVLVLSSLLIIQNFWWSRISLKKNWFFAFVLGLIFLEVFWAAIFLPTHFLVNGFFITLVFYVLINLFRHAILGSLNRRLLSRYLILGFSLSAVVLATAQWI